jgi:hypothetical protein
MKISMFRYIKLCILFKSTDVSEETLSVSKNEPKRACYLLHAGFLLDLLFDTDDEGDMFHRK